MTGARVSITHRDSTAGREDSLPDKPDNAKQGGKAGRQTTALKPPTTGSMTQGEDMHSHAQAFHASAWLNHVHLAIFEPQEGEHSMERTTKGPSAAVVASWGSALVTFGLIQGALYLKAYWGHFGLDPFQYVAVSEIALAGLAGVALALGLMVLAILVGDWLGDKITSLTPDRRVLGCLALVALLLGLGAIIWWANAWAVLLGALLTVVFLAAVSIAPTVPAEVKKWPWLTTRWSWLCMSQ